MNIYQQFIAKSKYARYLDDKKRREHWPETVDRYFDYFDKKAEADIPKEVTEELKSAVLNLDVMPSMRLLMTAGKAHEKSHVASFNCSFVPIDDIKAFDEIMYVLMAGTGVGFSVENAHVDKLPEVPDQLFNSDTTIVVSDSKEGWAKGLRQLIALLYSGEIPKWDFSKIRPAGARLKTFGGRASGPGPLDNLFNFCVDIFKRAKGRKLTSLECHDIVCKIAEVVIVGSVRRCLPAGTRINTPSGFKCIEDLKVGDLVKSEFGQYKRVLASECVGEKLVFKIETDSAVVFSTQEHRWAIFKNKGEQAFQFKELKDIVPGEDYLVFVDDSSSKTKSETLNHKAHHPVYIKDIKEQGLELCYDIQVEETESFCVEDLLTHNSALISLSDLNDKRLREAKTGEWWRNNPQRALSNNSASYHSKPEIGDFMDEWVSIYKSHSGERGIFNHYAIKKHLDKLGRKYVKELGSNPCLPETATILTPEGIKQLKDVKIGDTIWSGQRWTAVTNKQCTGVKPVYAYETSAGIFVGTENHRVFENGKRVEVQEANSIDIALPKKQEYSFTSIPNYVLAGLLLGDGSYHKASDNILLNIGTKDTDYLEEEGLSSLIESAPYYGKIYKVSNELITKDDLVKTYLRNVPEWVFKSSVNEQFSFLRGLYSANGSVVGGRITLKQTSKLLIRSIQLLLNSLGIRSYITINKPKEVKFKNGYYLCKQSYDLNIGNLEDKKYFYSNIGFIQKYKQKKLKELVSRSGKNAQKNTYQIADRFYMGVMEVFDITVEAEEHSFWTNGLLVSNCSEIILNSNQFCNLTTVVVKPTDTFDEIKNKIKLATILGTYQAKFVDFPYLRKIWRKQTESEALLGVSMTGIFDNPLLSDLKDPELPNRLEELKKIARETNEYWAPIFNVNVSAAITCIKPEGTTSQLCNVSSGLHGQHSKYYFRTIRSDNKDPLTKFLKDNGVYSEPCVHYSENTTIFYFGKKAPPHSILREDLTAVEHLELWLLYQRHYCEHKPSVTINVKEHEWLEVGAWVYKNWDEMTGVSFLPYDGGTYKQAPYQEIDEETYNKFIETQPSTLDWDLLIEHDDNVEGVQQLSCTSGQCEL